FEAVRNINSDLERVKTWSDDHGLLLNSDKCNFLPDGLLHLPSVRLEISMKAFRYFRPEIYNTLPLL
ncbi:hypothetical protein J6590_092198, partial [Homalodisca vitripennis]